MTDAGETLYAHNAGTHMVPASNQKLLSSAFALYMLGPDFRPKTRFWFTDRRTVIDAEGDPMLAYRDLKAIADKFHPSPSVPVEIREPYAPIFADSWEVDDIPGQFAAPVSGLTFDRATFRLVGKDGQLALEPKSFGVRIEASKAAKQSIRYDPVARVVTARLPGRVKDGFVEVLSLPRADFAAGSLFGGNVSLTDSVPTTAPDATIEGSSIGQIVEACLPPSDNNLAEHLFLLAANHIRPIGDEAYPMARAEMTRFLTRTVGISTGDIRIWDGSGMSRHNFVTTSGLCNLLLWADHQNTASLWHGAMAKPGKGTLARRLEGLKFEGKTGSLDQVAALSGYLTTSAGKKLVVSIIVNGYGGTAAETRAVMDAFVRAVSVTGL